jgi:WhiB family redox-sensing transcriptional regulator
MASERYEIVIDRAWMLRAACRGVDPNVFFVDEGDADGIAVAKRFCTVCVVQVRCLDHALKFKEGDGIWGGATPKERRRIVKQRTQAARRAREAGTVAS